jgi:hypothetical protein
MALIGKHLDVVTDCGGDNAKNAAAYEEDGEPEEPRLVEGEKHRYRLSGDGMQAIPHRLDVERKPGLSLVPARAKGKAAGKALRKAKQPPIGWLLIAFWYGPGWNFFSKG